MKAICFTALISFLLFPLVLGSPEEGGIIVNRMVSLDASHITPGDAQKALSCFIILLVAVLLKQAIIPQYEQFRPCS
jgi:hypothetical protein